VTGGVVLVEGESDRVALETLARRLGLEGVSVVAIGGAHGIGRHVDRYAGVPVVGLCDAGEAPIFRRALEHVFVCDEDLEDELIRALGTDRVQEILEANGDLGSFRTFQKQVEWRGRPARDQLRRFLGSGARRKVRYAERLVEALDLDRVPAPLAGVLRTHVRIMLGPSQMDL
jgi:hypothetical protein